jgi:hypothetical protein
MSDKIIEIAERVARLETKIDAILELQRSNTSRLDGWDIVRAKVIGIIAGASLFAGGVGAAVGKLFAHE